MGIHGLLPQLKSIMSPIHIKELQGECVAVDTYSWLHKGALSCSRELCKGLPTSRLINYCMHRINLLRHHGVKPLMVFDGGLLPMKADQEAKRSRTRKENLERAMEHESAGNSAAAYECYQKAVDISPAIAFQLIQVLRKENVDYIVAPYEADAQMAFLSIKRHVAAVITEDSDLIPFGCSRIIFKMDKFGQGVEFRSETLAKNKDLSFFGFTKMMFLEMCIFSGCDYLQSLPGMGLKKAYTLMQNFKNSEKAIKHLRFSTISVPAQYEESFRKAAWTFQYQRVYDPNVEDLVHLSDIPDELRNNDCEFLGPWLPQNIAKGIANGDLDPITKMPFLVESIDNDVLSKNIQVKEFSKIMERKKLHLPVQKNTLTNYFCLASIEARRKFKAPQTKHSCWGSRNLISSSSKEVSEQSPSNDDAAFSTKGCRDGSNGPTSFLNEQFGHEVVCGSKDKENQPISDEIVVNPRIRSLLLQSKNELYKPFLASHKKIYSENLMDVNKEETFTRTIEATSGTSKFFEGGCNNNLNEKPTLGTEDRANLHCENATFGNKNHSVIMHHISTNKRKVDNQIIEGQRLKSIKSAQPHSPTKGINLDCDLSHLERYSSIAEESMDRFVSIISAFRYNSKNSGSRVSGLRAPLKDVQDNSCSRLTHLPNDRGEKTTAPLDLNRYAYTPKLSKHFPTSLLKRS